MKAAPVSSNVPAAADSAAPASDGTSAAASDASGSPVANVSATSGQTAADSAPAQSAPAPASCTLSGSGLYFVDAISTDEAFTNPTRVPDGFVGSSLDVPPPTGAVYYVRLRDDPKNVATISLPAGPL
jgi:hypothetical protein